MRNRGETKIQPTPYGKGNKPKEDNNT